MEGQGFCEMVSTFYFRYTLPSRAHFSKLMERKYKGALERVKALLEEVKNKKPEFKCFMVIAPRESTMKLAVYT